MYRWLCKRRVFKEQLSEAEFSFSEERKDMPFEDTCHQIRQVRSLSAPNLIYRREPMTKQLRKCNTICTSTNIQQRFSKDIHLFNEENYISYQHHLEMVHARAIAQSEKIALTAYVQNVPHADINHTLENAVVSIRFSDTPEAHYYTVSEGIRALRVFSMVKVLDEDQNEETNATNETKIDKEEINLLGKENRILNLTQNSDYAETGAENTIMDSTNCLKNHTSIKSNRDKVFIENHNSDIITHKEMKNEISSKIEEDLIVVELDDLSDASTEQRNELLNPKILYKIEDKAFINKSKCDVFNYESKNYKFIKHLKWYNAARKNSKSKCEFTIRNRNNLGNIKRSIHRNLAFAFKKKPQKLYKEWNNYLISINWKKTKIGKLYFKLYKKQQARDQNFTRMQKQTTSKDPTVMQRETRSELHCSSIHFASHRTNDHNKIAFFNKDDKAMGDYMNNETVAMPHKFSNLVNGLRRCAKFFNSVQVPEHTDKPSYKIIFVAPVSGSNSKLNNSNESECEKRKKTHSLFVSKSQLQRSSVRNILAVMSTKIDKLKNQFKQLKCIRMPLTK